MAEEKTEKKKAGIVRRILKWFGLTVLSVLIILGLIFEAPWKVITLLLIVLAACRILPKPAIKWFWLTVGIVVIVLIIWVFLPEADGDWRPYTFDEELAALEAKYAIPDEENAATIYNQILNNYDKDAPEPNFVDNDCYDLTRSEPWASDDHPEIAQWLKGHQNTITKLLEASKVEKCRFPIKANIVTNNQWSKRSQTTRHWALLFITAASNDIAEGRSDQALEKYIAVLQMGKHQCQQPTMVDLLVGIAIEALATNQLNRFVVNGDVTEQHLSIIESALSEIKHDWSYDLLRILEYEKLVAKKELAKYYEFNPEGKIRLSRDPWEEMRASMRKQLGEKPINKKGLQEITEALGFNAYPSFWQKKLMKARTMLCWLFLPCEPQKAAKIIDKIYDKYYAMAKPDFDWDKMYEKLDLKFRLNYRYTIAYSAGILGASYKRIHEIYHRVMADQKGSRLLIALRRYKNKNGYWPKSLDDIKSLAPAEIFLDPVNGDSFVYKLTEENFTLYSKGKNNIDENGEYNSTWDPISFESKVEEDDRLIWPPWTTKAKEENPDAKQQ